MDREALSCAPSSDLERRDHHRKAAHQHCLAVAKIESWQDRFLVAAENALRNRPKDEEALKDARIKHLKQKVGELLVDLDILKEAMMSRPFDPKTSGQ